MRLAHALLLAAAVFSLPGCDSTQPVVPDELLPKPVVNEDPLPSYGDLIRRYNAAAEAHQRVWAEAWVDIVWIDEEGDQKSEHGDGRFMYVAPDKLALEIQEFGKGFWMGGDGERYWLFDLQDERTVYVGRFDRLDALDKRVFPTPVNPAAMLYMMGLRRIDPDHVPEAPGIERVAGHYLIAPPGLGIRMLLHPETARPVQVDLLDEDGEPVVKCILSKPAEVKLKDETHGDIPPVMASVAEVYVLDREARMTLKLKGMTNEARRIRDSHFDFDTLMKVYKPDELVDIDAPTSD